MLYNYTIDKVLNAARGEDHSAIKNARIKVSNMMELDFGNRPYKQKRQTCSGDDREPFVWKKLTNTFLAGYSSFGPKAFATLEEAISASQNLSMDDAGGVTYLRKQNEYTLRVGNIMGPNPAADSWIRV